MSGRIRWGILSTASFGDALVGPMRHAPRSELLAIASRSLEKAQAYANARGIPKSYGSYEALLADPEIDAVYVPLPNALHCEWTVKAAVAGKHVLCEKPLVTTSAELDQVQAAAEANGVTIFEAFAHLHHPQTRQVKEIIQSGKLGDLQVIIGWQAFFLPPEDRYNIRLNPELAGGSLRDVGVYPVTLAIIMAQAGPPVEVWANHIRGETGVDIFMAGQMRFCNGVVAQFSCGFSSATRRGAQIMGSQGILKIPEPSTPKETADKETRIFFSAGDEAEETIVIQPADAYLAEVEAMEACVFDGAKPVVPLSLSRDFLRTVLALYESAELGRLVKP